MKIDLCPVCERQLRTQATNALIPSQSMELDSSKKITEITETKVTEISETKIIEISETKITEISESNTSEENPQTWLCSICFGLLEPQFIETVANKVAEILKSQKYSDTSQNFLLSLNSPVSSILREEIFGNLQKDKNSSLEFSGPLKSLPFRTRLYDFYIKALAKSTGRRPAKKSQLAITITFCNDEFNAMESKFLLENLPDKWTDDSHGGSSVNVPKKRRKIDRKNSEISTVSDSDCNNFTKLKVTEICAHISGEIAARFPFRTPTRKCQFRVDISRQAIFLAGRYCKCSRNLPQTPWTVDEAGEGVGIFIASSFGSVSQEITAVLKEHFRPDSCKFSASGREDIDVRMLGTGRPFLVQMMNARALDGDEKVKFVESIINQSSKDVSVNSLALISKGQTAILKTGEEEKRKTYTALCVSSRSLSQCHFDRLKLQIPIKIRQKTPVRVLKRRPLIERNRTIFDIFALAVDSHRFLLRLTTQAGTYVKEFVHGDFGRTEPSLADLLMDPEAIDANANAFVVDILELDVEEVHLEWPPLKTSDQASSSAHFEVAKRKQPVD